MIKKILVSQPQPTSDKSPYFEMEKEFGVQMVFRPFIKVEGLNSKEFRQQKVSILNYTSVVFTSRHAIDNYFNIAAEMHANIPETTKYFCVTETIAYYIQKYIQYRKRKVFFSKTGKIEDLVPLMQKHKTENYLVPLADVHDDKVKTLLDAKKLRHTECVMYRTLSNPFTEEEAQSFDYDMCLFFSPSGVNAFKSTFGDTKNGEVVVGTFGPATAKAAHDAELQVALEAPTQKYPSMTAALKHYLEEQMEEE